MAKRQIVIEIDDIAFQGILRLVSAGEGSASDVAIASGTILPKGHGKLIDADDLWDAYQESDYDFYEAMGVAKVILEADEEDKKRWQ